MTVSKAFSVQKKVFPVWENFIYCKSDDEQNSTLLVSEPFAKLFEGPESIVPRHKNWENKN